MLKQFDIVENENNGKKLVVLGVPKDKVNLYSEEGLTKVINEWNRGNYIVNEFLPVLVESKSTKNFVNHLYSYQQVIKGKYLKGNFKKAYGFKKVAEIKDKDERAKIAYDYYSLDELYKRYMNLPELNPKYNEHDLYTALYAFFNDSLYTNKEEGYTYLVLDYDFDTFRAYNQWKTKDKKAFISATLERMREMAGFEPCTRPTSYYGGR